MPSPASSTDSKQQLETPAVVLDCWDHGESDLIVTFFCQGLGRLTGIAKGAKRSKKRFVNKLELFSSLKIRHTVPASHRLSFIAEAELHESFLKLRRNFSCYIAATTIREFLLLATRETEGDEEIYPLLIWALHSLENGSQPQTILVFFLIRLFSAIGYSPRLHRCEKCSTPIGGTTRYSFSHSTGSVYCSNCQKTVPANAERLTPGTVKTLTTALTSPLNRLHRLGLSPNSRYEALNLLHAYGRQLFQRDIISWKALQNEIRQ